MRGEKNNSVLFVKLRNGDQTPQTLISVTLHLCHCFQTTVPGVKLHPRCLNTAVSLGKVACPPVSRVSPGRHTVSV